MTSDKQMIWRNHKTTILAFLKSLSYTTMGKQGGGGEKKAHDLFDTQFLSLQLSLTKFTIKDIFCFICFIALLLNIKTMLQKDISM